MLPTKFQYIWPSGFRGEDFLEIDQSETRITNVPVATMFVNALGRTVTWYKGSMESPL
jgi:hypothetical protein